MSLGTTLHCDVKLSANLTRAARSCASLVEEQRRLVAIRSVRKLTHPEAAVLASVNAKLDQFGAAFCWDVDFSSLPVA